MIIAAVILIILFVFTWWLSVKLDNYSFVDVTWSLAFTPVAIWYAMSGLGWVPRRIAIAALISAWSLRLGLHLWRRVAGHHPSEDARYAVLREKWQANPPRAFLLFFMMQAVLVWLLMLPVYLLSAQTNPQFHALEWAGLGLWAFALIGEGLADSQLSHFKRTNTNPTAICESGLWHYSRHPNYFFQSLLWWGLFLMAVPAPMGWLAIIAPLTMLHFLLNVTGIPLTEKLSLQKRGEVFREYQRTTSAFVPWFRRK
jgi:steroid 5-alpha reductase family enzyme